MMMGWQVVERAG